jgi:hypothetical protein
MPELIAIGSAAIGIIVGVATAYAMLRKDHRESRAAALTEATATIDLMREQTDLLRNQGETREREWSRLEEGWHVRETRLETRITDLERDYRALVLTITTMGLCANAPNCSNYNPGDRRRNVQAGGAQVASAPA